MEIIRWDQEFSVGIEGIDKQHQSLFDAINDFYSNINRKGSHESLMLLLNKLKDYTVYHFQTEEQLMQRYSFPGYASHKKQHDSFIDKINDIEQRIKTGKLVISIEVTNFLKEWLVNHILKTDKSYSAFLQSRGVH